MKAKVEAARKRFETRRRWSLALVGVVLAMLVVFVVGSGAVLAPSKFEGDDGNMVVNTAGNIDWETASTTPGLQFGTLTDLPTGPGDNSFGQGSKENDTSVTIVNGTVPPNKNDLLRSYLGTQNVGGQTFIYLSWVRFNGTGDAHVDFELNQNQQPFDASTLGKVTLNRTPGDLLITYDFGGSGTPVIRSFTWNGSNWGLPTNLSDLHFAEAGVNTATIDDLVSGGTIDAGNFGEASVNLSAIPGGIFQPGECGSFGSVYVKARTSGESEQAELKDFIAPAPIHLSNCAGTIEVKKQLVPANNTGKFDLTIGATPFNNGGAGFGDGGTTTPQTLPLGNYGISESAHTGTNLSLYTSTYACTRNGVALASGTGTSVPTGVTLLNNLDAIVCTFTNTFVKQPSTTATTSSPTGGSVVPGTSVSDGATVSGGAGQPVPTGSVDFFLCQPAQVTAGGCEGAAGTKIGATKNLVAGAATSDAATTTTAIGTYCWRAEYSGDGFYLPSTHTNATTECFTTVKQPSSTATTSSPTGGSVVPGTSVSDGATVSGGAGQPVPTGSVDFFLCQPAQVTAGGCEGAAGTKIGATKNLVAGAATSDAATTTTAIGTYCWRAEYSGDGFYLPSTHTNATTECFTTVKQPSSTATTSSPTGGSVVPGTSVSDGATVSGGAGQPVPTGSVDFFLCQPAQVTAGGCEGAAGTKIGATKNLVAGAATSDAATTTTAIGTYCWRAEYSGDGFYLPSTHTNATTECFTTVKQPSSTATTSSPTGGSVVPGTSVSDGATVSGGAGQPVPTGSVDFFLCQPAQVTAGGCEGAAGTKIGATKNLVAGAATSDAATTTTAIGTYCWRAEYSGDGFYLPSTHTNATTECFTTVKQPSSTATTSSPTGGSVVPGTSVSDGATVSGGAGQPVPTGSVDFFLCQPAQVTAGGCEGAAGTKIGATKNLVAGAATSDAATTTTAIGTYCWRAEYSGDGFYLPSTHTNATTECFTTVKQDSSTDTLSAPTGGGVVPGTQVRDNATVTGIAGGPAPTGTVTFRLCGPDPDLADNATAGGCIGGTLVGGAVSLTAGGGNPPTATAQSILAAATLTNVVGKYCWSAAYSGDGFYNGSVHTDSTNECFSVGLQASTTTTASSVQSSTVVPGTTVTDTATVAGVAGVPLPTGTVTFFLCQPATVVLNDGDCHFGGAQVGGAKTLVAGVVTSDPAADTDTTAIGTYCWRAVYGGDSLYTGSSELTSTNECFTTVKQPSTTATTSSPTGGSVVPGTSASDGATVSGGAGQPTPTGTVDFFLCQPAQVTAGGCEGAAGTKIGLSKTLSGGSATSDATIVTTAIGTYCWRAEYSGDAFYNASAHTNATTECFTTVKQPSTTATTSSPTDGNVVPGSSVSDSATVSGGEGQPTPTGTVTFFLCQPGEVTLGGCETGGTQIGTPAAGEDIVAGVGASESTANTTAIGTYCWRAEYSGDGFYNPSSHTNHASECFTTVKQPSTTATTSSPTGGNVVPNASVSDSATVSGGAGQPTPTGTVKFFLCQPFTVALNGGDCSAGGDQIGSSAAGETLNASGVATSEPTANTTAVGTYCWRAEYSGDGFYLPSTHTNATTECFTTVKQPSTTATTSSPTGGSVAPGTSASDGATVSGGLGQPAPTGTVDFFLCQPAQITAGGCEGTAGTKIGATKTLVAGAATSDATTTTTAIGTYCWRAEYSGDGFYLPSTHTNATTECFTTVKQPSTTATTSSPTGGSVALGASASDGAVVSGGTGQPTPTGTVNFFLCQPGEVTAGGCEGTAGTKIGATKTLSGGSATSDATTNTGTAGTYCWRADYSGDAFYNPSTHTNATSECFTTVAPPPPPPPSTPSNPHIAVTKSPKEQSVANGATVAWTIVVTNDGNVTLTNVRVADPVAADCAKTSANIAALASMAPGASTSYTCTLAGMTASFTNVATATGTPPAGADVTATDSAHVTVAALTPPPPKPPVPTQPAISIVKSPNSQSVAFGGTATFVITVTNTGDVTLHDVTVTDPLSTDCDRDLGTMAAGAKKSYTCTKANVTKDFTNVANAVGTSPSGKKVTDSDTAPVTAQRLAPPSLPAIKVAKSPGTQEIKKGGTATFKIKVTNTGNVTLHSVTVNDPHAAGCNRNLGKLARGKSKTYSCTQKNVQKGYTNVATASGISPTGKKVTDQDTALVSIFEPPTG